MNIMIAISTRNNSILRLDDTLHAMGHNVSFLCMDDYNNQTTYLEKKFDELNIGNGRRKYEENRRRDFFHQLKYNHIDLILWINTYHGVISDEEFLNIDNSIKQVSWCVDAINEGCDNQVRYLSHMSAIAVLEYRDFLYLRKLGLTNVVYCPIGYVAAYAEEHDYRRETDIVFVGSPLKNRLKLLESLAKSAKAHQWNLKLYGPFWEKRYFWKKWVFKLKYPIMYKYIHNGSFSAEEVAQIYASSKICLNIHNEAHKSPNPRTFDILATGALEIIDKRENYIDRIVPDKALVEFEDTDDLLEKAEYYLQHDSEREKIAAYGHEHNIYSMDYSLRILLEKAGCI